MMGGRRQGSRLNGPCLPCPTLLCGGSWPSNTVASARPNKEHRDSPEFPFSRLALAIRDEKDQIGAVIRSTVAKKCRFWWIREIRTQMEADDGDARRSFLAMR